MIAKSMSLFPSKVKTTNISREWRRLRCVILRVWTFKVFVPYFEDTFETSAWDSACQSWSSHQSEDDWSMFSQIARMWSTPYKANHISRIKWRWLMPFKWVHSKMSEFLCEPGGSTETQRFKVGEGLTTPGCGAWEIIERAQDMLHVNSMELLPESRALLYMNFVRTFVKGILD